MLIKQEQKWKYYSYATKQISLSLSELEQKK